jgi:cell division septation protein DedD
LVIVKRRGLVVALVAAALLAGCASFVEEFDESSRDSRAASSTSASASETTSEATTSSAGSSTSGSTATESPAATSGPATTAAGTTAPAPAPPPAPAPANKPAEIGAAYGTEPWAVYLIAAQDYSAAERSRMEAVHGDLQAFGYRGFLGTLCDEGAEAAGVDSYGDAVVIYFRTQAEAQQFIALWNRPVVGSAKVLMVCGD